VNLRPLRFASPVALAALVVYAAACTDRDAPRGDPVSGQVTAANVDPACSRCHTLDNAGWEGRIGPDLDDLRPGYQRVLDAIRTGPGLMPSYDGLGAQEQHDIAAYVSGAATTP
jgi:cytochrome c6